MTIAGDLNASLTNFHLWEKDRKEIVEHFFYWLTCADVISALAKQEVDLEEYLKAVSYLKGTQV